MHTQALNLTQLLNSTSGINLTGVPLVANISLSGRNRTVITASAIAAATAAAGELYMPLQVIPSRS
jgi:stage V sporulation protein SpoVS